MLLPGLLRKAFFLQCINSLFYPVGHITDSVIPPCIFEAKHVALYGISTQLYGR